MVFTVLAAVFNYALAIAPTLLLIWIALQLRDTNNKLDRLLHGDNPKGPASH